MSATEKIIHRLFMSIVFTLFNWILIDWLIVDISFWRYLIIEVFLVISMKFYIFTTRKMNL